MTKMRFYLQKKLLVTKMIVSIAENAACMKCHECLLEHIS